jgi:hypothetical protein
MNELMTLMSPILAAYIAFISKPFSCDERKEA